uniref:Uncharacterized protein n=1 Tax=Rhizophora mucronata TaxID=61149 RepID=A0A2P2NN19_RHIMU
MPGFNNFLNVSQVNNEQSAP